MEPRHYHAFGHSLTPEGYDKRLTYLVTGLPTTTIEMMALLCEVDGYKFRPLPEEDERALQLGKTYVNRGQCAPIIYMTGSLMAFLTDLQSNGVGNDEIVENYAFLTAKTAGGACRLPTLLEEVRKALAAIGLERFVVEAVEIGSLAPNEGSALELDRALLMKLLTAIFLSDVLDDMQRRIRAYERHSGQTDRVMREVRRRIGTHCSNERELFRRLRAARKLFEEIPVDLAQIKPRVHVIGETYVSMNDAHCTGRMHHWLESEGAEVTVQSFTQYYLLKVWRKLWLHDAKFRSRRHKTIRDYRDYVRRRIRLMLLCRTIESKLERFAKALGNHAYNFRTIPRLRKVTKGIYDHRITSGEGLILAGEHLLDLQENDADMILSLKPFPCLANINSGAIEAKIENRNPKSVFLSLEVSGDATANVRSRVQMKLFEARRKVQQELSELCRASGSTPATLKRQLGDANPGVRSLLRTTRNGSACTFLRLVREHRS